MSETFFDQTRYFVTTPPAQESEDDPDDDTFHPSPNTDIAVADTYPRRRPLPLPPSLPFSPDSIPFKRHLEALSYSLSDHPDTSWETYQALHNSLKPFVPNDVYRSLISHQLSASKSIRREERIAELLAFADTCGMAVDELGLRIIEGAFVSRMTYMPQPVPVLSDEEFVSLEKLWQAFYRLSRGDLSQLSTGLCDIWLQVLARRFKVVSRRVRSARIEEARRILYDMMKGGANVGLGHAVIKIFLPNRTHKLDRYRESLRTITDFMNRGNDMPLHALTRHIKHIADTVWNKPIDGAELVVSVVRPVEKELRLAGHHKTAEFLSAALIQVLNEVQPVMENKVDSLLQLGVPPARMIRGAIRLLRPTKWAIHEGLKLAKRIDNAIVIFEAVARRRFADPTHLIAHLFSAIHSTRQQDLDPFLDCTQYISRIAHISLENELLPHIDSNLVNTLFYLLATCPGKDVPEVYSLTRRVYTFARATDPPQKWDSTDEHSNRKIWRSLFKIALAQRTRQLHFASRLYADSQADGMSVYRTDALHLIRTIGQTVNASRYVLLERHLKDYQHLGHGTINAFVWALVQGLTRPGLPRDALLAYHLARRILQNRPIPHIAIEAIIVTIMHSKKLVRLQRGAEILFTTAPYPDLPWLYEIAFRCLTKASSTSDTGKVFMRDRLSVVIGLWRNMQTRSIRPTTESIGFVTEGLSRGGHVDSAFQIIHACLDHHYPVTSFAIGRVMLDLGLKGRESDSFKMDERWRASPGHKDGPDMDPIYAARYLLASREGRQVSMKQVTDSDDWEPTQVFWELVESMKQDLGDAYPQRAESETKPDRGEADGNKTSEVDESSSLKRPVTPLTRSLWTDDDSSRGSRTRVGWWPDDPRSDAKGADGDKGSI